MAVAARPVGGNPWRVWLRILLLAVLGNLLLRLAAVSIFEIPSEFPPLAVPIPTVFFTVVGVVGAAVVWVVVGRTSAEPLRLFRTVAIVVLLVSFVPDLWLLTDGAASLFPGATVPAVLTLMLQHVLAATVVIWMLTATVRRH